MSRFESREHARTTRAQRLQSRTPLATFINDHGKMIDRRFLLLSFLLVLVEVSATRILYVVTSSSYINKDGSDRWGSMIEPVIETSVKSMLSASDTTVDLYLVLSYTLPKELEESLRSKLPESVGLEIWEEATPIYFPGKDTRKPSGRGKIRQIPKTLARQHRFVVKDKLLKYDFFVAMEDDMLVHAQQVDYHMRMSHQIEQMKHSAPDEVEIPPGVHARNMFYGPMNKKQISKLWPGFVRVEVLQEEAVSQETLDEIPIDMTGVSLNASVCCHMGKSSDQLLSPDSLIIWETAVNGLSVRELPEMGWVVLLQGPSYTPPFDAQRIIGSFYPYSDFNLTRKPIAVPSMKNMAQTGGWMATRKQLIELDTELCRGGFFPPFNEPHYEGDGLFGHNSGVEYWSGGIQMWTLRDGCNMQRVIPLQEFSYALLYHTANNKQRAIKEWRRVLAQNLLGQLNTLIQTASRAKNTQLSDKS